MKRTEYAYEYAHDGALYIGCNYGGEYNIDCTEYDMYKVNCETCDIWDDVKKKEVSAYGSM